MKIKCEDIHNLDEEIILYQKMKYLAC